MKFVDFLNILNSLTYKKLKKNKITQKKCIMGGVQLKKEASLWCLAPFAAIFQLYRRDQFC